MRASNDLWRHDGGFNFSETFQRKLQTKPLDLPMLILNLLFIQLLTDFPIGIETKVF